MMRLRALGPNAASSCRVVSGSRPRVSARCSAPGVACPNRFASDRAASARVSLRSAAI
jgi:hypothetical protein